MLASRFHCLLVLISVCPDIFSLEPFLVLSNNRVSVFDFILYPMPGNLTCPVLQHNRFFICQITVQNPFIYCLFFSSYYKVFFPHYKVLGENTFEFSLQEKNKSWWNKPTTFYLYIFLVLESNLPCLLNIHFSPVWISSCNLQYCV